MAILKIEHLGIAVNDASAAKKVFEQLLGKPSFKEELVESESVNTIFYELGESKLELLEATDENSAIAKYLGKNRPGIHHMAVLKSAGGILLELCQEINGKLLG